MKFSWKIPLLVTALLVGASPTSTASITMSKLRVDSYGYLGVPLTAQISLNFVTKINLKVYLQNDFNEKIIGRLSTVSRNDNSGTWLATFKLAKNARVGKYKLILIARSKDQVFRNSTSTVYFERLETKEAQTPQNTEKSKPTAPPEIVSDNPAEPYNSVTKNHMKSLPTYLNGLKKTCDPKLNCPETMSMPQELGSDSCKIIDATYPDDSSEDYLGSGFPVPKFSLSGKKEVNLVVVPITFQDFKISQENLLASKKIIEEAQNFYRYNSFGRINFSFELLPEKSWIRLPQSVSYYQRVWDKKETDVTQFLLDQVDNFDRDDIDAIMWLLPKGNFSFTSKKIDRRSKIYTLGKSRIPQSRVYGLHEEVTSDGMPGGFTHGLGHALYSFEDLYIFAGYSLTGQDEKPASFWDVMSGGGEFFGWSKWIAGWLKDSEVICLDASGTKSVVSIASINDFEGRKLIVIPVSESKAILAEYRTNPHEDVLEQYGLCQPSNFSQCESRYLHSGLLIYSLDTKIKHGAAPFRVAQKIDQPLLAVGQSMEFEGRKFSVLASANKEIFIEILKL